MVLMGNIIDAELSWLNLDGLSYVVYQWLYHRPLLKEKWRMLEDIIRLIQAAADVRFSWSFEDAQKAEYICYYLRFVQSAPFHIDYIISSSMYI